VEADERVDARGQVVRGLDEADIRKKIKALAERGVQSLTISLLNSYVNPVHEHRIRDIAREVAPKLPVTCSFDILPQFREYERAETSVMNSYVRPVVAKYLRNLQGKLKEGKVRGALNVLRSDGGLMSVAHAEDKPVHVLMSGPSGGVTGALFVARAAGFPDVMTFDMGGTSTDVSLNQAASATISRETNLATFASANTLLPIKVASVDVRSVGAGGGSIAHVPELTKALRVGPQSAGAEPGPACYGKGGTEPTVTDANVVLGHLPPVLLGGKMKLDVAGARKAVRKIADAMGLGLEDAAQGILNIVNESMCGALRLVSVERGYDPRNFALVAFGGAGPLHANALGILMQSWPVIIPPAPGVLCAMGDVSSEYRNEFGRSFTRTFDRTSPEEVAGVLEELGRKASEWLSQEDIDKAQQEIRYEADFRYYRQGYELHIPVDPQAVRKRGLQPIGEQFSQLHNRYYKFRMNIPVEIVNLRAIGVGKIKRIKLARRKKGGPDPRRALLDTQPVWFDGRQVKTSLYDRALLAPGHVVKGPAIVTETDSTTVVHPGYVGRVDEHANILIRPGR
jgi:N-methylhydantoinase A